MKIGFHYHVPALKNNQGFIMMPGYLGVFIDSLADYVDHVFCFLYTPNSSELSQMDYIIRNNNVTLVSIGPHQSVLKRLFSVNKQLNPIESTSSNLDFILLRSPSPLAPFFYSKFKDKTKLVYLIVGNYLTLNVRKKILKKIFIRLFHYHNFYLQKKAISNCLTFVNSRINLLEFSPFAKEIHEIKTTTLTKKSFFKRNDTCQGEVINLLYTGRIDLEKGLIEMVKATSILRRQGLKAKLHIVGWEDFNSKEITNILEQLSRDLSIEEHLLFHGKKQIGEELDQIYRMADIYLIASKGSEGFPRTIWEAMANSLPVIASSVGSIPHFLSNNENALLIEPNNIQDIVEKINYLLTNNKIRKSIIKNAYNLSLENTLDNQSAKMVKIIKKYIQHEYNRN